MKYLEDVKPKQFYSYALFKNIFGEEDNYVPDEIKSKSLIVNEDIKKLIELIKK